MKKGYPSIFAIETVLGCNLRCPECVVGSDMITRPKGCMSFDRFKILADKIDRYCDYLFLHIWGEPLLNKDVFKIIEYASRFSRTNISTNGMLVTDEIADRLIRSGVTDIIVSIDGVSQDIYEKYRVGGNVDQAFLALNRLVECNNRSGNRVSISPQFIVFEHNQSEMKEFRNRCNALGLTPSFKAPYLRNGSRYRNSSLAQYCRPQISNVDEYKMILSRCNTFTDVCTVDIEGNVVLCCYDSNSEVIFGNLFKQNLEEIYKGKKMMKFKEKYRLSNQCADFCLKNCLEYGKNKIRVVLWGVGNYGNDAYSSLYRSDFYEIVALCDTDSNKIGTTYRDLYEIENAEIVLTRNDYDMLLLCSANWEGMYYDAVLGGVKREKLFCWNGSIIKPENTHTLIIHSQDGEELYLRERFVERKVKKGVYVDVGAYHPTRFSNTAWAYNEGWNGINIEPNTDGYNLFKAMRPDDINLNIGISNNRGKLKYYQFDEPGINTFDEERARYLSEDLGYEIRKTSYINVIPLQEVLDKYNISHIDFLDIDVEEHEMDVLQSISFDRVTIDFLLVEQLGSDLQSVVSSEIAEYLGSFGYTAKSKFDRTVIYERSH